MRQCDVKCEGEVADDGSVTVTISVSNLTMAEAQAISNRAKAPFREIVHDVLSKGGTSPIDHRNLQESTN